MKKILPLIIAVGGLGFFFYLKLKEKEEKELNDTNHTSPVMNMLCTTIQKKSIVPYKKNINIEKKIARL